MDATCGLIAAGGVRAATSRRITDAADVNLAAITYYFGSKQALIDSALAAEVERLVQPALHVLESNDDPTSRLLLAVQELLGTFALERERAPAYLAALLQAAHDPRGGSAAAGVIARLHARLVSVVAELVDGVMVPSWVDPDAMASVVIAAANGIALQSSIDPDGPTPEAQAAQLAQLFLAARV